jgi:hypothetical protein
MQCHLCGEHVKDGSELRDHHRTHHPGRVGA